jgi:hypothetical protein
MGSVSARWFFGALYYVLPNLANLSFITPAAHGELPGGAYVASAIFYSLLYVTVVLAAATLIFSRRNFK